MAAGAETQKVDHSSSRSSRLCRQRFRFSEEVDEISGDHRRQVAGANISLIGKILIKCWPNAKFVQKKRFLFEKFNLLLSRLFYHLGVTIADNAIYFILIPIVISFIFATAFVNIEIINDPEFLFTPQNGRSRQERKLVEQYFPMKYNDNYRMDRRIRIDRYVALGITVKNGGNLINQTLWEEIRALDLFAKTFEFQDENGTVYTYRDICAKNRGKCVGNWFLDLTDRIHEVATQEYHLPYPVMFNSETFDQYVFPSFLGGITLYPETTVKSAEAMLLSYWCNVENERLNHLGSLFEHQLFAHYLNGLLETPSLDIAMQYSTDYEEELEHNTQSVMPYFSGTIFVMLVFCLASLTTGDCVRSKTILGLGSLFSSIMACATAFGILLYCGVPFIGVNMAAPFLMERCSLESTCGTENGQFLDGAMRPQRSSSTASVMTVTNCSKKHLRNTFAPQTIGRSLVSNHTKLKDLLTVPAPSSAER